MIAEFSAARTGAAPGRGIRRYRLAGKGAFEALFRAGRRWEGAWLQVVAVPAQSIPGRVGFVIGAKVLRNAVDRNRVRRALRVAVASGRPAIEAFDVILRLKRGCARNEVPAVATEAAVLLAAVVAAAAEAKPQ